MHITYSLFSFIFYLYCKWNAFTWNDTIHILYNRPLNTIKLRTNPLVTASGKQNGLVALLYLLCNWKCVQINNFFVCSFKIIIVAMFIQVWKVTDSLTDDVIVSGFERIIITYITSYLSDFKPGVISIIVIKYFIFLDNKIKWHTKLRIIILFIASKNVDTKNILCTWNMFPISWWCSLVIFDFPNI